MTDQSTAQDAPDDIGADLRAALQGYESQATPDKAEDDDASEQAAQGADEASTEKSDKNLQAGEDDTDDSGDQETAEKAATSDDAAEGADSEETSEDESDQDEDEGKAQDADAADLQPVEPPNSLSAPHKEAFKNLPRDAQEFVAQRINEMEAGFHKKTEEHANLRKTAEEFNAAVEPYKPYLASINATPTQAFKVLMSAEYQLRTGTPERKGQILAQLAKDYGVKLTDLVDDQTEDDDIDPIERKVNTRLEGIERQLTQQQQAAANQVNQEAQAQVQAFAEAKDETGNPKHPHFDQVRALMGQLVEASPGMDLETAYQNAVWANPELRQQQLEQERAAAEAKATAERDEARKKAEREKAEKVRKAKKAAAAVSGRSTPPGRTAKPEMGLRDEIKSTWDQLSSS